MATYNPIAELMKALRAIAAGRPRRPPPPPPVILEPIRAFIASFTGGKLDAITGPVGGSSPLHLRWEKMPHGPVSIAWDATPPECGRFIKVDGSVYNRRFVAMGPGEVTCVIGWSGGLYHTPSVKVAPYVYQAPAPGHENDGV